MSARKSFVVCLRNDGYAASLERRKLYQTLADAGAVREGRLRVIDESGEDYLYPASNFARNALTPILTRAVLAAGNRRVPKKPKSPQEKKRLSLQEDRRNTYGENDKSSRKNITRSKALSHRSVRHAAKQTVRLINQRSEVAAELLESTLTKGRLQKGRWKKSADTPLGDVIKAQTKARTQRENRRKMSNPKVVVVLEPRR